MIDSVIDRQEMPLGTSTRGRVYRQSLPPPAASIDSCASFLADNRRIDR